MTTYFEKSWVHPADIAVRPAAAADEALPARLPGALDSRSGSKARPDMVALTPVTSIVLHRLLVHASKPLHHTNTNTIFKLKLFPGTGKKPTEIVITLDHNFVC